jgi:AraC family transcriptional activator of pobA
MKKLHVKPITFNSIPDLHRVLGLSSALHPLVSLVDNTRIAIEKAQLPASFLFDFYKIAYQKDLRGRIKYGQNYYDFDEGSLAFTAPNQLMSATGDTEYVGYSLLIHPDFIRDYPLGKNIKKFGFFGYAVNESLHLSEKENSVIQNIFKCIEDELQSNIDDFSQDVIVAQIELLLNYSNRFYKRQFITRKAVNNDLLSKLESKMSDYFENQTALIKGLPTVQSLASRYDRTKRAATYSPNCY